METEFKSLKINSQIRIGEYMYIIMAFVNDLICQKNNNPYYLCVNLEEKSPYFIYLDLIYFQNKRENIEIFDIDV